jgi:hypothetical protein
MANYTLPTNIGFARFNLTRTSRNAVSESPFTFAQQVLTYPGQRWVADVTLPPLDRAQLDVWRAFFAKLNGREHTFNLGDPLSETPKGSAGGTPVVNGASQTGSSLVIDGATPSQTGWLLAGDYIQLGTGGDARLYMVTDDVNSDGSGNVTIPIWPDLQIIPSDNDSVIVSNTVGTFRLTSDDTSFETNSNSFSTISFNAVSVV